jgi:hypothetical protein
MAGRQSAAENQHNTKIQAFLNINIMLQFHPELSGSSWSVYDERAELIRRPENDGVITQPAGVVSTSKCKTADTLS